MPPTVDEIIAKLKQTPVDYRDIKDAPNLDDVQKLIGFLKQGGFRGGGDTVEAGSNIYISHVNGVKVISSTGGLGAPVEPTSGTIDNSNKVFTFLVKPTLVNVNGIFYREGKGWSWTAGTLTVTLDNPVGTGGDIFAL